MFRWISYVDIVQCFGKYMVEWCNYAVNYRDPEWKLYCEQHKWVVYSNVQSNYCIGESITCVTNNFNQWFNDVLSRWFSDIDLVQCFRKYLV